MTAAEAIRLSEQACNSLTFDGWIAAIDARIAAAASVGSRRLINPCRGQLAYPHPDVFDAIRKHYESAGFTWIEHPPAQGFDAGYTEIKW